MSMIFAHAPVIVPSLLGRPLPFGRGALYVPLALLHASLVLRLAGGDRAGSKVARQWGGSLNEIAVLLFLALAAVAVIRGRRTASARIGKDPGTARGRPRPAWDHRARPPAQPDRRPAGDRMARD